jgi:hypothetical protein
MRAGHFITCLISVISLSILTVGFAPSEAYADEKYVLQTGADLQAVCANPENTNALSASERQRLQICGSYIQGFLGHYSLVRKTTTNPSFCLDKKGVSAERIRVVFLALLQQRPQIRDMPANIDLASSIAWAYPCKEK